MVISFLMFFEVVQNQPEKAVANPGIRLRPADVLHGCNGLAI